MAFTLLLLILAMGAFVFNHNVLTWLNAHNILSAYYTGTLFQIIKWTVFFLFMVFFLSVLYFMAPAQKNRFKFFSFGSVVASVFSFITIRGFDFFISNFNKYNEIYGGLSALFILMLFVYILANIFLIGFEINVAISFGVKEGK